MIRFEDLSDKVQRNHPGADLELLKRAYIFSAREHKGQVRQSGEPYLSHPLEVANLLAEMKLDVVCVSVGLLHDVVEDTLTTIEKIRELFGEDVAHIVDGVTKISKIEFSSRHEKQAENFRKLLLAMVDDIRVILVKLADRLHNMRTLQYLPSEKRKAIAEETLEIYAPIAHRLGMARIRSELEDLAFSYLDPAGYQNIVAQVEERKSLSEKSIAQAIEAIQARLREQGIEAEIQHRIKRIYSIYSKMRRQRIDIQQVYDFVAIRILTESVKDCYAVLGIVNNMWSPVPGRIKDFIAIPRPNMYQSVHTTVIGPQGQPLEVQIRTREMHRVAEEGIAAHWKYKEGKLVEERDDKRFAWLRHLLEWQQEVRDPHQFLSNLKIDLYPEEVYTFTPKGKVITLPRGATPLDFAYAIHTEVGHHCVGAKVSGRLVSLKHDLKNGEIVEILTSPEGHPSRDWLALVHTSRARNRIRHWINVKQKERALELGKKLFNREARKYKLSVKKLLVPENLERLFRENGYGNLDDVYSDIGYGKAPARQILMKLDPEKVTPETRHEAESAISSMVSKVFSRGESKITVKGHGDLLVYRAKCCNPIRGEDIVGYITLGKGIAVHALSCPNLENLLHNPERRIDVEWSDAADDIDRYPVKFSIQTEDRQGVLADITSAVSKINTNIVNVNARSADRRGVIDMTVEISDTGHMDKVLHLIKTVSGVRDVERVR
ncbi:MAG: RelA/SpoT family protein [Acidobacteriota bacterium]